LISFKHYGIINEKAVVVVGIAENTFCVVAQLWQYLVLKWVDGVMLEFLQ
jgi:hypothetical protein